MSSDDSHLRAALEKARKSILAAASDAIDPAAAALKALIKTVLPPERPAVSQAQTILQLSRQPLLNAFDKSLREVIDEELLVTESETSGFHDPTDWMSMGLVDEDQFENRLTFERVGQLIGHECDAELREIAAYTGELRGAGWADPDRNPVRGQVIASALYKAVEKVAEGDQCRRLIVKEWGQALAKALPDAYRQVVKDFSSRGFRQVELAVRPAAGSTPGAGAAARAAAAAAAAAGTMPGMVPGMMMPGMPGMPGAGWPAGAGWPSGVGGWPASDPSNPVSAGLEAMRELWEKSMMGRPLAGADSGRPWDNSIRNPNAAFAGAPGGSSESAAMLERLMQEATSGALMANATSAGGVIARTGTVSDADLMTLLRRLNDSIPAGRRSGGPSGGSGHGQDGGTGADGGSGFGSGGAPHSGRGSGYGSGAVSLGGGPNSGHGATDFESTVPGGEPSLFANLATPTNLIRAHRDELVQAAGGEVDHMVIEVVASLFDQILADTRVPPEIAREIARLQMPVLRVALRDPSFFSARKHPVRRFINRISTLATSFGGFDSGPGKELLVRVNALVSEIIDGDFDSVPLYSRKLGELEQFVIANARENFENTPAAATLQAKEAEWQVSKVFKSRLQEAYEPLAVPEYLKTFLTDTWSKVVVAAAQGDDPERAREKRFRRAAFHVVASIQPKRSPEERQQFLSGLRGLTSTLDEGLALIGWPREEHDAFFGKLIADHSGSLKAMPGSDLDHNLLLRQLDAAARTPMPGAEEVGAPAVGDAFEPRFTPREAARVGLLDDAAVDWSSPPPETAPTVVAAPAAPAAAVANDAAIAAPVAAGIAATAIAAAPAAVAAAPSAAPMIDVPSLTEPAVPAPAVAAPAVPAEASALPAIDAAPADANAFPTIVAPPAAAPAPLAAKAAASVPAAAPEARPAAPVEPDEPTEGPQLLHHLQIGASYRLHLKEKWEKVRLMHMNASKTFFMFVHGVEDRGTISMTARMIGRLCSTGRMKAYEEQQLLDRATERLRSQAMAGPAASAPERHAELSAA